MMEFFPTKRAGTKLIFEGREYHKRKTYVNGNTFWQCIYNKKCKRNLTVSTENKKIKENSHSSDCLPNMARCKILEKMSQLKKKVCENYDPIQKQFEEVICQLKDDGVDLLDVELPKFENIKSGLYKARNKQLQVPKLHYELPKDVKEIIIIIRNTNYVEGWHSRLNRYVSVKNPSIAKVLDILEKEMKIKNSTGKAKTRKQSMYVEIDEEINSAIEELKRKTITVGHCVEIIAPFVSFF